jgi:DNA-binding NtrC family response regulator
VISYIYHFSRLVPAVSCILVVEDDIEVQKVLVEFLRSLGHVVLPANCAEEARALIAAEPVELALIDCLMSGEQGSSLAEHAAGLSIPVILTTGDPEYLAALTGSPLPLLPKPFRLSDLQELLARALATGEERPPA